MKDLIEKLKKLKIEKEIEDKTEVERESNFFNFGCIQALTDIIETLEEE